MGEIADFYIDRVLSAGDFHSRPPERGVTWVTGGGKVMRPSEMTDIHLINCIHLCERRDGYEGVEFLNQAPTYCGLVDELIKRGKLTKDYYRMSLVDRAGVKMNVQES